MCHCLSSIFLPSAEMPVRKAPPSLRSACILAVGSQLPLVCFGCRDRAALDLMLETEQFRQQPGPFTDWPPALLHDLYTEAVSSTLVVGRESEPVAQVECC